MTIDSIRGVQTAVPATRSQSTGAAALRNNPSVLNEISNNQRAKGTAVAVPLIAKNSNSNAKLPRGSLVDILA